MRSITSALAKVLAPGRNDDLTEERADYAVIGRIVAIPFSVANVYERFADQSAQRVCLVIGNRRNFATDG
jgi:hypothetical protein